MFASSPMLPLLLLLAYSSPAVLAAGGDHDGLTHIHLFVHEKFTGTNATATAVASSPLGANSSFGSVGVADDELRVGRDRSSQLLGRYQAIIVGTSLDVAAGYLTSITLVFTAGEHAGSTLSIQGPVLGFKGVIERAVVGGTGKFRFAQGYSLTKILGNPTPETVVFEVDLFVLLPRAKY
ncbi:hypothetical protein PR202_gb21637 [Eleusine coracana subsp. coracana]|uniref:Dirigent protein n=1 Tax=Eleusine coracana subsp. coracana TaxID=191504 RepID=A0AAV5FFP6_ELECO|nr:hypothetical protein QOZ80_7BG0608450 [Eleusine coracana subsp. coracana]GJN33075.1 hypothetical protein PR202_gb21637 [Eleusine coracana subsp. coracana]